MDLVAFGGRPERDYWYRQLSELGCLNGGLFPKPEARDRLALCGRIAGLESLKPRRGVPTQRRTKLGR